ncbi:hypothetical protein [Erwinia phyllosphaerae]|uniref:hypothetical protein n=1 Tax=Erwinia phyllosphaerae TaxID=2853256 RepID=UPI001FF01ABD|nr:hypothetical protein [Erwinia phyllosphaerae]
MQTKKDIMKTLNSNEINMISGAGLQNYNMNDMSREFIKDAISGGLSGATAGSVAVPGTGFVPGWLAGAPGAGSLNGILYGGTCWW